MSLLSPPAVRETEVFTRMPAKLRRLDVQTERVHANRDGRTTDSFLEGPVWCPGGRGHGHLYVTDVSRGRVFRISMMGGWKPVTEYDGEPNDMEFVDDARLPTTDYHNGPMLLDIKHGEVTPYLERRNFERFKGVNDLTFDSHGSPHFADQDQTSLQDPAGRVYRLLPEGRLDILFDDCPSPNRLVPSPDGKVLYVAMTRGNCVWRVPLQADNSVSKVKQLFMSYGPSGPDGLMINTAGRLFVANPGLDRTWVLNHRAELDIILANPKGALLTNLYSGGSEMKTLFITEPVSDTVLKTEMDIAGPLSHRAKQSKVTPQPQLIDTWS